MFEYVDVSRLDAGAALGVLKQAQTAKRQAEVQEASAMLRVVKTYRHQVSTAVYDWSSLSRTGTIREERSRGMSERVAKGRRQEGSQHARPAEREQVSVSDAGSAQRGVQASDLAMSPSMPLTPLPEMWALLVYCQIDQPP